MKKVLIFITLLFTNLILLSAQNYTTIDISDDVYSFLTIAETKGYCGRLDNAKPYTKDYVVSTLQEIKESILEAEENKYKDNELKVVDFYLSRYETTLGLNYNRMAYRLEENEKDFPITLEINNTSEVFVSGGMYNDKALNSTGYEIFHNLNFIGDFGTKVSYRMTGFVGLTKMDLQKVGDDYLIGYWWYDEWKDDPETAQKRTINTYRNNNVLPYSYKKKWDGSIYYLSNLTASGLEGWPFVPAIGLGMYGEVRSVLCDDRVNIGIGRINREWAAMDTNSSLVFNSNASPFFSFDINIKLFKWLSFSTLTGVTEFPNAEYIDANAWNLKNEHYNMNIQSNVVDSYYFQNAYSIGMFNFDFGNVHADFGSTCVWPKRFELGYMFPIIDRVVYQNSVGDFDNLALFGDLKGTLPGIGSAWFSVFLDEINSLAPQFWKKTRCMYAWQGGLKGNIPFLPFTTISFRYTKVEPYCYTHQAITKQPWYDYYISEAYMNNGKNLGYYLEPNSDELFVRIESKPLPAATFSLQYQLVRHGADYGSGAVKGSSIWSELPIDNKKLGTTRDSYYKYFLHDGAYEWTNIINFEARYNLNQFKVPVQVTMNAGYIYDYWTKSEGGENTKTPYHKINTNEYPEKSGVVISIGMKLFAFDICQ